jgi:hypothetical protein
VNIECGFDGTALKRVVITGDDLTAADLRSIKWGTLLASYSVPAAPAVAPVKRPKTKNLDDDFYSRVAGVYRWAVASCLKPRVEISRQAEVSTDVAGRWIYEARRRGLLAPTSPGRVYQS